MIISGRKPAYHFGFEMHQYFRSSLTFLSVNSLNFIVLTLNYFGSFQVVFIVMYLLFCTATFNLAKKRCLEFAKIFILFIKFQFGKLIPCQNCMISSHAQTHHTHPLMTLTCPIGLRSYKLLIKVYVTKPLFCPMCIRSQRRMAIATPLGEYLEIPVFREDTPIIVIIIFSKFQ